MGKNKSKSKSNNSLVFFRGEDKDGKSLTTVVPLIQSSGSASYRARDDDEKILVDGNEMGHDDCAVLTTHGRIKELLATLTKEQARAVFIGAYNEWRGVDTDALHAAGGEPWNNFTHDIVLFYVARHLLFGRRIPVMPFDAAMAARAK